MSEVQRYSPIGFGVAKTDIKGMLVAYEDYMILDTRKEQLKAEVERLKSIVGADAIDREHGMCCDSSSEIATLKAEVERLRASSFVTAVPVEEYERLRKELAESQENYHLVNEIIKSERNVHRTNTMMLKDQIDGLIIDNQLLGERVLAYQRLKQLNDISRPSNEA